MNPNRLESLDLLLSTLVVFFTILLLLCSKFFPNDGQTFQVISGLLTGFAGALLMRIKGGKHDDPTPPKDPAI